MQMVVATRKTEQVTLAAIVRLNERVTNLENAQHQSQQEVAICLAEYARLAAEQAARVQLRDNMVLGTIVGEATIVTTVVQSASVYALLVMPAALYAVCHTYSNNDRIISLIGTYLGDLGARLDRLTGSQDELLRWDRGFRHQPGRWARKIAQLIANLLLFFLPAVGAIVAVWMLSPASSLLFVGCVIETLLCAGIFVMLLARADLLARRAKTRAKRGAGG